MFPQFCKPSPNRVKSVNEPHRVATRFVKSTIRVSKSSIRFVQYIMEPCSALLHGTLPTFSETSATLEPICRLAIHKNIKLRGIATQLDVDKITTSMFVNLSPNFAKSITQSPPHHPCCQLFVKRCPPPKSNKSGNCKPAVLHRQLPAFSYYSSKPMPTKHKHQHVLLFSKPRGINHQIVSRHQIGNCSFDFAMQQQYHMHIKLRPSFAEKNHTYS